MTKEDIIRMAREAELIMETDCTTPWMEDHDLTPYLERFAALVAAHEREQCASIAAHILKMPQNDVSTAIRIRGDKE